MLGSRSGESVTVDLPSGQVELLVKSVEPATR